MPDEQARTVELPSLCRRAAITPSTIDDENRTVELTFSTGAAVRRTDWWTGKSYIEKLSMEPSAIRLDRLNSGGPLLDAHSGYSIADQIGVVEDNSAKVVGKKAVATVRFSARQSVEDIWQDVRSKIIRNVSVGYIVHKFEESTPKDGGIPTRLALDWEPYELSLVPMPADAGAQTRTGKSPRPTGDTHPCQIITRGEAPLDDHTEDKPMEERNPSETLVEQNPLETPTQRLALAKPDEPTDLERGAVAERERITGIMQACAAGRMTQEFQQRQIDQKVPLVVAQANVFEEMKKRGGDNAAGPQIAERVTMGDDPFLHKRKGIQNALEHRIAPGFFKLEDHGREYRGMTLMDIAKVYLNARGIRTTGMSRLEVAGLAMGLDYRSGYHTTSDYSSLLADVARKTLRRAYDEVPQTFQPIARRTTLSDFKVTRRLQLGDAPNLELVKEHGEFTRGTIGQGSESMQLETFGRIFAITRQALVNDDTDAFSRVPMLFGRAARKKEADIVWAQITNNAAMADGFNLFSSQHANLQTDGDVISIASLTRARLAIRLQTGLDGETQVNVVPRFLVVPPSLETVAEQIVAPIVNAQLVTSVNPFAGRLTVIVEPRLEADSSTAWYLVASPDQVDVIEYAYLEGEEGPAIENRVGFDIDGLEIKCRLDFDAAVVDFRGLHKDPGEAVS